MPINAFIRSTSLSGLDLLLTRSPICGHMSLQRSAASCEEHKTHLNMNWVTRALPRAQHATYLSHEGYQEMALENIIINSVPVTLC